MEDPGHCKGRIVARNYIGGQMAPIGDPDLWIGRGLGRNAPIWSIKPNGYKRQCELLAGEEPIREELAYTVGRMPRKPPA